MDITFESIKNDLISLGILSGDTIFLRISYKSIGKIAGGPKTFLDSIIDVVGEDGTVLLTAFPLRYKNKLKIFHRRDAVSPTNRPKSNTGAMSNIAMTYPNAYLSSRVDFPFVAIGKNAKYLTNNHTYEKSGYWILEEAIEKFDCKCLRVGGEPFIGTTHMSLSHILKEKREYQMAPRYGIYVRDERGLKWRENENVIFCPNAFKGYLPEIIDKVRIEEGKVGNGYAIVTDMKKSMFEEEMLLRKDIKRILCDNPDCWICRTSFSFSDTSRGGFLMRKIISILSSKSSGKMSLVRAAIEDYLFATKNQ